jgi:hypothetical protein
MPDSDETKKAAADAYWQSLARRSDQRTDEGAAKDAITSERAPEERTEVNLVARRSVSRRRRV